MLNSIKILKLLNLNENGLYFEFLDFFGIIHTDANIICPKQAFYN
jgi:hypothetical protein